MILIYGQDEAVTEWVTRRISTLGENGFGPCVAIGISDGTKPIAGAVFHDYYEKYGTLQMSMAADSPRWCRKGIIKGLLEYPFERAAVRKLWTCTPHTNERALRLNRGVGFTQEAILSRHFGREHAVIMRMFDRDYAKRYKEADYAKAA